MSFDSEATQNSPPFAFPDRIDDLDLSEPDPLNRGATMLKTVGVDHFGPACELVKDVNGEPSWNGD